MGAALDSQDFDWATGWCRASGAQIIRAIAIPAPSGLGLRLAGRPSGPKQPLINYQQEI